MENNSRIPILKGKPFFEQLKLSINFIDSNMKLIDNSVKTSNTDEEYDYVKKVLNKVDKLNEDVNNLARCLKVNNLKRINNNFEDELQNLKDNLRFKEIEYQLEPFKYQQTKQILKNNQQQSKQNLQLNQQVKNKQLNDNDIKNKYDQTKFDLTYQFNKNETINLNSNKTSSLKKKDTFVLKENKNSIIKKPLNHNFIQPKDLTTTNANDLTNDSINQNNQFSFDFKMPYNKLKNNYYPSNSTNFSVDESLEIEFTPGLKSRRTGKKNQNLNESNSSTQILKQQFDYKDNDIYNRTGFNDNLNKDQLIKQDTYLKQDLLKLDKQQDTYLKQDLTIIKQDIKSPSKTIDLEAKVKSHKLSTPKKPPNFDFFDF